MRQKDRSVNNFWQELQKEKDCGFVGLAPMDGVTDLPMRIITGKYGAPDVIFTEFTNVEGWVRGAEVLKKQLWTKPNLEGNTVAQLYGLQPENFRAVAHEISSFGFKGIDINMGCPAKNVAENGAGAGLINNKKLAQEIFLATKEGANGLAVSIKTRLGFYQPAIDEWLGWILTELKPDALTIHGRTYKQGYTGLADWELIARVAQYNKEMKLKTVIIGNGDVKNRTDAEEKVKKYGVDGALIGRATFGQPTVFRNQEKYVNELNKVPRLNPLAPIHYQEINEIDDPALNLKIALEHAYLFEKLFQNEKRYSFLPMRKHLAWYTRGFQGATKVRVALTQTNSAKEVAEIINNVAFLQS